MVIDFDKGKFLDLMATNELKLPIRWGNKNFEDTLQELFNFYCNEVRNIVSLDQHKEIKRVCRLLMRAINHYHDGFPATSFNTFSNIMKTVMERPFRIYNKTGKIETLSKHDNLNLYRVRNVSDNREYSREEIFHTPFCLRSRVATCRYSIAGYPCLYLSTSLDLCCEETKNQSSQPMIIASKYKIVRNYFLNGKQDIKVIELGVKPIHFVHTNLDNRNYENNLYIQKYLNEIDLINESVMKNYLYWYPIIAASSFIRINKNHPFATEYIIPQLMMQWVRSEVKKKELYGIRYFSCASERASELGFNYVFPAYSTTDSSLNYCGVLSKSFKLTKPEIMSNYCSINACEKMLESKTDLATICP